MRAVKDIERGTEAVGKAKKWMVQASADYSIGFLDVREVSDAVEAYVTLRTGLMKARFDHNVAMASLSKATGTLDGDSDLFYLAPPDARTQSEVHTMTARPRRLAVLVGALALAAAADARAGAAQEAIIKKTIDAAFAVLKDKSLAGREKRPQRISALRAVADRAFNWAEMARSSLGAQWRSLDGQQRGRFVEVFKEILAARYMDDIDRFQGTETVTVDGSAQQDEEVVVRTTLVTGSRERVPIDYRMRAQQGSWMVVDITIEGVSLVNHFRKTFARRAGEHDHRSADRAAQGTAAPTPLAPATATAPPPEEGERRAAADDQGVR